MVLSASASIVACGDDGEKEVPVDTTPEPKPTEPTRLELIEQMNQALLPFCMKVAACGIETLAECEQDASNYTGNMISEFDDNAAERACAIAEIAWVNCVEEQTCGNVEDHFSGGLTCADEDLAATKACKDVEWYFYDMD